MEKIIEIISWVGSIQGALLIALLTTRVNNRDANRLLAIFIAVITFDCLEPLIFEKNFSGWLIETWGFLWGGLVFLHGPLMFLYVRKMTTEAKLFEKSDLKHYTLPLIYYVIVLIATAMPLSPEALEVGSVILHELFLIHLIAYSAVSLRIVKTYQNKLEPSAGEIKKINLNWLKALLLTTLCLYLTSMVTAQIKLLNPEIDLTALHMVIQLILVVIMYTISYRSITQPQILSQLRYDHVAKPETKAEEKYRTSSLDPANADRIRQKLLIFMDERKPFLDPNLSLESLAKQIGESKYHVSQVLNELFKQKFNDFVNKYRVEEFKHLMLKPRRRKLTVENLAKLSGFNSKASFHGVFKKITGQTPSKFYRERMTTMTKDAD